MKRSTILACTLLALTPLATPAAADAASPGLAAELVGRWTQTLRGVRAWSSDAIALWRAQLETLPPETLRAALETRNWDTLQSILISSQGEAAAERLARATQGWRSGAALDETDPREAQLKQTLTKALGDADKDLIFVPIQPCTTWDTRFATVPEFAGAIGPTANKPALVWNVGGTPFDWSASGGNPSCTDTAVATTYGVTPYAVAYTLYTSDATANGWVTAYRDGDPDPSAATISLYYTPGPTRSTTVVTRVGRANGQTYDVRVASQFASVHATISVIGYFLKSGATALECVDATSTPVAGAWAAQSNATKTFPACPGGYTRSGSSCGYDAGAPSGVVLYDTGSFGHCGWRNNSGVLRDTLPLTATSRCCRVPGR